MEENNNHTLQCIVPLLYGQTFMTLQPRLSFTPYPSYIFLHRAKTTCQSSRSNGQIGLKKTAELRLLMEFNSSMRKTNFSQCEFCYLRYTYMYPLVVPFTVGDF